MGCQEKIVANIYDNGAEYVIGLKGNQGALREVVEDSFSLFDKGRKSLSANDAKDNIDGDHGRIDQRKIEVIDAEQLKLKVEFRPPWLIFALVSYHQVPCLAFRDCNAKAIWLQNLELR